MECHRLASLVVLTLLQLCRAELHARPQWYSANLINDGFQPKPISEIFSSAAPAPFSHTNPIIVTSTTSSPFPDEFRTMSSLAPPTHNSLSSTTPSGFSTFSTFPSSTPLPPMQQQYLPQMNKFPVTEQPPVEIRELTLPAEFEPNKPLQPQRNVQIQLDHSTAFPSSSPEVKMTSFSPSPSTELIPLREIVYELPQNFQTSLGPASSTAPPLPSKFTPPLSNYFVVYQAAPQTLQGYQAPSTSVQPQIEQFTTAAPISSNFMSTFSPSPTFSTTSSLSSSSRTSPAFVSTTVSPSTEGLSSSTLRPSVTTLSTIGSSSRVMSKSTTPLFVATSKPTNGLFPLTIRVTAPKGSLTKVNINPMIKPIVTTQKPCTTRRPTTRRTHKPKKNTYERCLQGCRKNGQTLCASPMSQSPIDPKELKAFPSVCHMSCHNSYRKISYEKIVDGSCTKLRTRIRLIDSDSKLKRDELNKIQYTLDNSQHAIVEFNGGVV